MLHPVLSRLPPGYTKLCRRTGILCCTSAFGIDTNPFSRVHVSGVRMCVTADRNQNISYGISLALQNIALLFWQPSLRKKQKKQTNTKTRRKRPLNKRCPILFLLFVHLVVTHSPNRHMLPPPPPHPPMFHH